MAEIDRALQAYRAAMAEMARRKLRSAIIGSLIGLLLGLVLLYFDIIP